MEPRLPKQSWGQWAKGYDPKCEHEKNYLTKEKSRLTKINSDLEHALSALNQAGGNCDQYQQRLQKCQDQSDALRESNERYNKELRDLTTAHDRLGAKIKGEQHKVSTIQSEIGDKSASSETLQQCQLKYNLIHKDIEDVRQKLKVAETQRDVLKRQVDTILLSAATVKQPVVTLPTTVSSQVQQPTTVSSQVQQPTTVSSQVQQPTTVSSQVQQPTTIPPVPSTIAPISTIDNKQNCDRLKMIYESEKKNWNKYVKDVDKLLKKPPESMKIPKDTRAKFKQLQAQSITIEAQKKTIMQLELKLTEVVREQEKIVKKQEDPELSRLQNELKSSRDQIQQLQIEKTKLQDLVRTHESNAKISHITDTQATNITNDIQKTVTTNISSSLQLSQCNSRVSALTLIQQDYEDMKVQYQELQTMFQKQSDLHAQTEQAISHTKQESQMLSELKSKYEKSINDLTSDQNKLTTDYKQQITNFEKRVEELQANTSTYTNSKDAIGNNLQKNEAESKHLKTRIDAYEKQQYIFESEQQQCLKNKIKFEKIIQDNNEKLKQLQNELDKVTKEFTKQSSEAQNRFFQNSYSKSNRERQ